MVLPITWGVINTRGMAIPSRRGRKARMPTITVAMPLSSSNLARCPTDT